jgi:hypothetical protein
MIRIELVCEDERCQQASMSAMIKADVVPLAHILSKAPPDPALWDDRRWRIFAEEGGWTIAAMGWAALDWHDRVGRLRAVLTGVVRTEGVARLVWHGSGVSLDQAAIADALDRWQSGGSVPALQLIGLDPAPTNRNGIKGVTSRGLAAITGHEIEGLCDRETQKDQCILVARLIAHALLKGPIRIRRVKDHKGRERTLARLGHGYFSSHTVILIEDVSDD